VDRQACGVADIAEECGLLPVKLDIRRVTRENAPLFVYVVSNFTKTADEANFANSQAAGKLLKF